MTICSWFIWNCVFFEDIRKGGGPWTVLSCKLSPLALHNTDGCRVTSPIRGRQSPPDVSSWWLRLRKMTRVPRLLLLMSLSQQSYDGPLILSTHFFKALMNLRLTEGYMPWACKFLSSPRRVIGTVRVGSGFWHGSWAAECFLSWPDTWKMAWGLRFGSVISNTIGTKLWLKRQRVNLYLKEEFSHICIPA